MSQLFKKHKINLHTAALPAKVAPPQTMFDTGASVQIGSSAGGGTGVVNPDSKNQRVSGRSRARRKITSSIFGETGQSGLNI